MTMIQFEFLLVGFGFKKMGIGSYRLGGQGLGIVILFSIEGVTIHGIETKVFKGKQAFQDAINWLDMDIYLT